MHPKLMKGHKWRDHKHKMTYPAWAEVKSDEIRCHVIVAGDSVEFLSFAGKPLANMQKFSDPFLRLSKATGYTVFDTGFRVNGNFNDSYRWVRSTKAIPKDLEDAKTEFLLFDLPELVGYSFNDRSVIRLSVTLSEYADELRMHQPEGWWVHCHEDVEELFRKAVAQGEEGLMVKNLQGTYEYGTRSYGWLKVKPEEDEDGVIAEIHRAVSIHGEPLDRAGSVSIRMEDGSVATPHGIPHELGRDMFANPEKYVGQWAEFRYMERDRQGGYRHPTWHRLREAKA